MNAIKDEKFNKYSDNEHRHSQPMTAVHVEKTIEPEQVMPLLLKACPSFRPDWDVFLQKSETRLVYIGLGVFARHLLHCYQRGDVSEFPAVADAIEALYLHGTDYVKEAATGGLLEAIQNIWSYRRVDPEHFATYLKPASAKWWQSMNDFWDE